MDNNQKILNYFGCALSAFVIAALFKWVFIVSYLSPAVVTICALSCLGCLTLTQKVDSYMAGALRIVLFVIALVACGVFALMFIPTWTLIIIYLVALAAATMSAVATS